MIDKFKIAAYLEDAGEDPLSACQCMKEIGINYAVIRHVWTSNIKDLSDSGCVKLRRIMSDNDITPVAIIPNIGDVPANALTAIDSASIDRTFALAEYFHVPMIGFTCGNQAPAKSDPQIEWWLQTISSKCIAANLLPLIEITPKSQISTAAELAILLSKFPRIKLLYDPAQLIIRQNIDPFIKYWTLLKQYIAAIDVRDYKIGRGFKPVGFGDTHITRTINDAIRTNYNGWLFFEPSLGRKHGTAQTKGDVFKAAFATLKHALNQT